MLELKDAIFNFDKNGWNCDFSLKINTNDTLGIIGSSGSGKSTLLNLIAGFTNVNSGKVLIENEDYTNIKPSNRPVTMLFQEHNLFTHLNVFQNIAIGISSSLKLRKEDLDIIENALDRVGLKGFNKRYPNQLSGGQKQRIAIARTLVRRAPILLLDEPFSFLDPPLRVEMLQLVNELQKEHKFTTIMVTHDFNDCLMICNKTAFIDHGRILHIGKTDGFIENTHDMKRIRRYLGNARNDNSSSDELQSI